MPTPTFDNLPADKRERILKAAIAEFAEHVFARANIDRIAGAAEVSKGSLFQYFSDKDDLYVHAVESALDRAWAFHEAHIASVTPADCFELLTEATMGMFELRRRQPELAALFLRIVYASDSHARDRLYDIFVKRNTSFLDDVIEWGVQTNQLDRTLPEALVRFHIHAVGSHFTYLILSGDDPRWLPRSAKRLRTFVAQSVDLLARTLAPSPTSASR